jgi:hypothetical protein
MTTGGELCSYGDTSTFVVRSNPINTNENVLDSTARWLTKVPLVHLLAFTAEPCAVLVGVGRLRECGEVG